MTRRILAATLAAALTSVGCTDLPFLSQSKSTTTPSATGVQALGGTWSSVSSTTTLQNTCTNFQWTVTDITGNTGTGSFTATCFGNLLVIGTANGVLSGSTLTWTATAVGANASTSDCPISLSGTADLEENQIRVPFSGTTCLGPVSGTEILRK
jgi:hypothetical protein